MNTRFRLSFDKLADIIASTIYETFDLGNNPRPVYFSTEYMRLQFWTDDGLSFLFDLNNVGLHRHCEFVNKVVSRLVINRDVTLIAKSE